MNTEIHPANRCRAAAAILVAMALSIAGCGSSAPKPPTIAGCDAPTGDNYDITIRMIVKELRRLDIVTGEPRRSQFQAIFDGDRIKPDSTPMVGWFVMHENDDDLVFYGTSPGNWDLLLEDTFRKPYSAYRAYCTGWSFADYARAHPVQAPWVMPSYTPTPATPTTSARG